MSQCLRCSTSCEPNAIFCDECRSLLREHYHPSTSRQDFVTIQPAQADEEKADSDKAAIYDSDTGPLPIIKAPVTPQPPPLPSYPDIAEQAVSKLNEAAQLIAEAEASQRRIHRASRLTPLRDISGEIQRESTPMPLVSRMRRQKERRERADHERPSNTRELSPALPDLWPWLDNDLEEKENEDIWANRTDPLMMRHVPTRAEAARIEEEDMRRAKAEGLATRPLPVHKLKLSTSTLRIAFVTLALLALAAMIVDGVLLSVALGHPHRGLVARGDRTATLTLGADSAHIGDTVPFSINNFTPNTSVILTHDIQELVKTTQGKDMLSIGANGSASATIIIDTNWTPGVHLIVAEDITTHFTASATLEVFGQTPSRPAHLLVNSSSLNFGANIVGVNTIKQLVLSNSGSGSITWSASSDSPWLLIAPGQGMFNSSQTLTIAVQRTNLTPKAYKGTITIFSNVEPPQIISVTMTVQPLPANAGPVLTLSPALLSFTATDGEGAPFAQSLTISNPGTQPLNWSLFINSSMSGYSQNSPSYISGANANWLLTDQTSGIVLPGSSEHIQVIAQSSNLLPGTYFSMLTFMAGGAIDSQQSVVVSLTVQPHCGLLTSTGYLTFVAVQGQTNPANQGLNLSATASCAGSTINWAAHITSGSWLSVAPGSGQLKAATSDAISIGVNAAGLATGHYTGVIAFTTQQSTQSVIVQLQVQAPPPPSAPIMAVSPLSLNFSNTQGQPNPTGQVVTITNNGGSTLKWSTTFHILASPWLAATPSGGTVAPGQIGQLTINVNTASLSPGTYVGLITLNGTDVNGAPASGSPQTITVNLVVQPPCALTQPSSSALAFTAIQGSTNPAGQTVTLTATGSCVWPLAWTATTRGAPWLALTPSSGSIKSANQPDSIGVAVNTAGLAAGTYSAQVSISAADTAGTLAQGSPQVFAVTLTVQPQCVLSTSTNSLNFSVPQGTSSGSAQTVTLTQAGTCGPSLSWVTSVDSGSASWLSVSNSSGTISGSGGFSVNVGPASLAPGTYKGTITLTATASNGSAVSGSPQTIAVTLVVNSLSVSGTVVACSGPGTSCPNPQPLAGATITVTNSSGTIVLTVTADSSGNFTLNGLTLGNYTVTVSGTDSGGTHYNTSVPLSVTGNMSGFTIQAFPG
ncbi:MAG TPA: carboxypeptidase regulatory-like domain-containing protein [Ktedonobacteraceae bacterium]|jgi:hypothetical protein|nr:carboxypeptidase regulatory-like domain-containing protein [Ktedonobacteraceae bacterium]